MIQKLLVGCFPNSHAAVVPTKYFAWQDSTIATKGPHLGKTKYDFPSLKTVIALSDTMNSTQQESLKSVRDYSETHVI